MPTESSEAIRQTRRAQDARSAYHANRKPLDGLEFVYECYGVDGNLLYIGRTNNPRNRIYTHRQESGWWGEVDSMRWTQVPDIERQRIIAKCPPHNKHGRVKI